MAKKIFLYANHPLIKHKGKYYAKTKNFVDFLSCVAAKSEDRFLAVPCSDAKESVKINGLVEVNLSSCQVVELPSYRQRWTAPFVSLVSATKLYKYIRSTTNNLADGVVVGGPGPNSFLFWCSWLLPKTVKYAFFIRGDTLNTVKQIYRGRMVYPAVSALVLLFRSRIRWLLNAGRADVFTFGQALLAQYPAQYEVQHVISPLIGNDWLRAGVVHPVSPSPTELKVLFVGRLSAEKNIINLIEACNIAQKNGHPFDLTIVGDGPLHAAIQKQVESCGLSERVAIKGHIASGSVLMSVFDKHDLLCLPSIIEGTPRVIVEAYARGCPVLASDVGSIRDMFPGNIRLLSSTAPDAIYEGLSWCFCHRKELSEMALRGRTAVDKFLLEKNAEYVLSILLENNQ